MEEEVRVMQCGKDLTLTPTPITGLKMEEGATSQGVQVAFKN